MFKTIRQYNSYTSKLIVFLAYILFPVVILSVFGVITLFIKTSDMQELTVILTVLSAIAMAYLIVVNCLADRFSIGTILVNNLQTNEMVKSSGFPRSLYCKILLSTGNGFSTNRNYDILHFIDTFYVQSHLLDMQKDRE